MERENKKNEDEKRRSDHGKKLINYGKYTGLAFQLFATIAVSVILGLWLDSKLNFEKPIITALLIPIFLIGFIYKLYIELNKDS